MFLISKHRDGLAIGSLALFNVLIHLLVFNNLEYHRDELLYFSLGLHPSFGYATVPPLIGWIASLLHSVFGFSLFAVKVFPALLSGAMVILATKIAAEMGGHGYAKMLTAIAVIFMPVTLRVFYLFQPVAIDLFLWTLLLYQTIRFVNSKKDKYLLYLGIVSGIALMNKYLIILLILSLIISILFSPHRPVFKKRSFYLGLLVGALIFIPNLIWQIYNGLPVIGHMQALNENQLVHVERWDFLRDQFLMTLVAGIITIIGLFYLLRQKKFRYLAIATIIVVLVLFLLRGKSYYTIGIIPVLLAAGSVALEGFLKNRAVRIAIPLLIVATTVPILPFGLPVYHEDGMVRFFKDLEDKYGLVVGRRFEDGTLHSLPQDYADQLGWEELTKIVKKAYNRIPEKRKTLIYCENYGQAGAIAVIGKKYGLPEPVSFHESFLYWAPEKFDPDIAYFIYVNDELGEDVNALFEEIKIMGSITNTNAREYGTTVYLCSRPRASFNSFWKAVVQRIENPF